MKKVIFLLSSISLANYHAAFASDASDKRPIKPLLMASGSGIMSTTQPDIGSGPGSNLGSPAILSSPYNTDARPGGTFECRPNILIELSIKARDTTPADLGLKRRYINIAHRLLEK